MSNIKWVYNKTRQRWITTVEGVTLVIFKMLDPVYKYRLSIITNDEAIDDSYMSYKSEFRKLASAKLCAWLMIYG